MNRKIFVTFDTTQYLRILVADFFRFLTLFFGNRKAQLGASATEVTDQVKCEVKFLPIHALVLSGFGTSPKMSLRLWALPYCGTLLRFFLCVSCP